MNMKSSERYRRRLGSGHGARVIGMWETMMENVVDKS
jgi:hypothetical protein